MREIFNDLQHTPERALQARVYPGTWKLFLVLLCIAATIGVSPIEGQNLSTRALRSRELAGIGHIKPAVAAQPLEGRQESAPREPRLPASALEQSASTQPQVFYEDGQLEILAENSALSDILAAVRERTGADIELPASGASERIYARIGPGPARKVLGALLSLTDLDFVIQAPEIDPQGIQRVLLTTRLKATGVGMNGRLDASPGKPGRTPARSMPRSITGKSEPSESENSGSAAPEPVAVPEQAIPAAQQLAAPSDLQAAPSDVPATTAASDTDPNKPATKTSEQMMQDLQNLYQLRKQQMQQLQQTKKP